MSATEGYGFDSDWQVATRRRVPRRWQRDLCGAIADTSYVALRFSGWLAMTTLAAMGATHVLRDNVEVYEFLAAAPLSLRVAYDALGGEAGRRLAVALRPGASIVLHSLHTEHELAALLGT